jgi:NADH-quinone oxidoreductase subunit E
LSLFWSIALFLIVAAVLGFAIGWLLRGTRVESRQPAAAPRHGNDEAALADERDRLQTELGAARDARAKLEASLAEAQGLADTRAGRVHELEHAETGAKQRIARLEQELNEARTAPRPAAAPLPAAEPVAATPDESAGAPPEGLSAPEGEPDDLKKISGIGPGIEKTLHGLGIYHFRQIAGFTSDNVAWVNQRLRFKGRIEREEWIEQARKLAAGETA